MSLLCVSLVGALKHFTFDLMKWFSKTFPTPEAACHGQCAEAGVGSGRQDVCPLLFALHHSWKCPALSSPGVHMGLVLGVTQGGDVGL